MSLSVVDEKEPNFTAIVRVCDKVYAAHNITRPFGLDKRQIIKLSLYSLVQSLSPVAHKIIVIGDDLSPEMVDFISTFPQIILRQEKVLNGQKTLAIQLEMALAEPAHRWVYLCEDDYLHKRECFAFIRRLIINKETVLDTKAGKRNKFPYLSGNMKDRALFIHPADYPDRYLPKREASYVFASADCHWRQIVNTTHTFMAQAQDLQKYIRGIQASVDGFNDKILSKAVYGGILSRTKALCLSPLPGLATHLTNGVMTPFVDWTAEFQRNRDEMMAAGLWQSKQENT